MNGLLSVAAEDNVIEVTNFFELFYAIMFKIRDKIHLFFENIFKK